MFKKLSVKIISYVLIISLVCLTTVSITSYVTMSNFIYENYVSLSSKAVNQNIESSMRYFDLIEEASKRISTEQLTVELLEATSENDQPVRIMLRSLRRSYSGIVGVSLYATSSTYSAAASGEEPLPFALIRREESVREFISADVDYGIVARTEHIEPGYFEEDSVSNCVISCITRVKNPMGVTTGYLFVDVTPTHIYDYFYYNSASYFADSKHFILTSDNTLLDSANHTQQDYAYLNEITDNSTTTEDGNYLILDSSITDNIHVISLISLDTLTADMNTLAVQIVLTFALLMVVAFILSFIFAKSITRPLKNLMIKMQTRNIHAEFENLTEEDYQLYGDK